MNKESTKLKKERENRLKEIQFEIKVNDAMFDSLRGDIDEMIENGLEEIVHEHFIEPLNELYHEGEMLKRELYFLIIGGI